MTTAVYSSYAPSLDAPSFFPPVATRDASDDDQFKMAMVGYIRLARLRFRLAATSYANVVASVGRGDQSQLLRSMARLKTASADAMRTRLINLSIKHTAGPQIDDTEWGFFGTTEIILDSGLKPLCTLMDVFQFCLCREFVELRLFDRLSVTEKHPELSHFLNDCTGIIRSHLMALEDEFNALDMHQSHRVTNPLIEWLF